MHHLTLRQLDYFIEIVESRNITRAAARLHVAPTALSLQVRAMEERLGVDLLQRHSRGVRPTPAGAELYQKARQILEMVNETERLVAPGSAPVEPVRLGVIPPTLRLIGVDAVVAGMKRINGMSVEILEGLSSRLIARLEDRDLDFVLAYEVPASPGISTIPLLEDQFLFATCPQDARPGGKVSLAEALATDLAFYSFSDAGWKAVHAAAESAGLPVRVAHKVGSTDVIRQMIARGIATSFMPFGLVKEEVSRGEIAVHEIEDDPILQRLHLAWLTDAHRPDEIDRILDFVSDVMRDLVARSGPHARLLPRPVRPAAGTRAN